MAMEMIENGMVIGADREYARLYTETPVDNATPKELENFAFDTECVNEIMATAFGIDKTDLSEEVAELIFSGLPCEFAEKCVKDWASNDDVRSKYNRYVEGK